MASTAATSPRTHLALPRSTLLDGRTAIHAPRKDPVSSDMEGSRSGAASGFALGPWCIVGGIGDPP